MLPGLAMLLRLSEALECKMSTLVDVFDQSSGRSSKSRSD